MSTIASDGDRQGSGPRVTVKDPPSGSALRRAVRLARREWHSRSRRLRLELARRAYRAEAGPPEQIHLSWTSNPATSLTVTWHSPGPAEGLVEYRSEDGSWARASSVSRPSPGIGGLVHTAELRGLHPATEYEYRVLLRAGGREFASPGLAARTAPDREAEPFTCAFFCDTGVIGRPGGKVDGLARILEELRQARPLMLLAGGDYAYCDKDPRFPAIADGVDAWFRQMQPLAASIPMMAQYGNHEVELVERLSDWEPRFAHPAGRGGRCYSLRIGAAHISAFYAPVKTLDPVDLEWLDADLSAARAQGARWLIVFQHQPIFAHGRSHPAIPAIRDQLVPILERHKVDLHLSGHDQNYERTFPLSAALGHPVVASYDGSITPAGIGTIYAKVSPSGKRSDIGGDFSRFTTPQQDFMAVRDDGAHHYAMITVRPESLEVVVHGVSDDAEPSRVLDRFTIVRT
jgi:hypothetical protein